ncbi:MAG: hypothetical protein ACM3SV_01360 [Betaproteobacteria bacterium]|nr:hypothetical protein [Azonexus sp.]
MSGFEHYWQEIAALDHEIRHYAAVCRVSLENRGELEALLRQTHENSIENQVHETLRGLLILRIRLETEMIELGYEVPPLTGHSEPE